MYLKFSIIILNLYLLTQERTEGLSLGVTSGKLGWNTAGTKDMGLYWTALSNTVTTSHTWLSSTCDTASPNWDTQLSVKYTPIWRLGTEQECKISFFVLTTCWNDNLLDIPYEIKYIIKVHFTCFTDICTPMFTAALFATAKSQKQTKCPSTDEWMDKCANNGILFSL